MTTAATTNDAASMRATTPPPNAAKTAAPMSGPTRRKASLVVWRAEFASTRCSSGSSSLSSPLTPAGMTTKEMP